MPDLAMPDLAVSNDPHDPSSCTGAPLVLASKFPMGASVVVLAPYTMKYEQRSCTDFTGCGSWGPSTPSWGPSGSGKVWLKVTTGGIIVAVVDNNAGSASGTPVYNLGMDCALGAGVWNCNRYRDTEIVEGANFLKFEGKDKFSGVELPVYGVVLANCARFYGTVQQSNPPAGSTNTEAASSSATKPLSRRKSQPLGHFFRSSFHIGQGVQQSRASAPPPIIFHQSAAVSSSSVRSARAKALR